MKLEKYLQQKLSVKLRKPIRNFVNDLRAMGHGNNLNKLAQIYGTDKWGRHYYTQHYITHFKEFKYEKLNLLEIGVGGYDNPYSGGKSLRMWKKYFPYGKIFSLDIVDKSFLQEKRIKIFKGSQVDKEFLMNVVNEIGEINLIVDDGSHINEHVIETFKILFPILKEGGVYVIEDTQTSYWSDYGGDNTNFNNPKNMMQFFKSLVDGINYQEYKILDYQPTYYDQNILSIHFYRNIIFIQKGKNKD